MYKISQDLWKIIIFCSFFTGIMQIHLLQPYFNFLFLFNVASLASFAYQYHIICAIILLLLLVYKRTQVPNKLQINGYYLVRITLIFLAFSAGFILFLNNSLAWNFDPLLSRMLVFAHIFSILFWGLLSFTVFLVTIFYKESKF